MKRINFLTPALVIGEYVGVFYVGARFGHHVGNGIAPFLVLAEGEDRVQPIVAVSDVAEDLAVAHEASRTSNPVYGTRA